MNVKELAELKGMKDDYKETGGQQFNYNGITKNIEKDYILTLTDTAIGLIERTQDPFFLWLAYKVPHFPTSSLPSFEGKYDNVVIPWQADTAQYKVYLLYTSPSPRDS